MKFVAFNLQALTVACGSSFEDPETTTPCLRLSRRAHVVLTIGVRVDVQVHELAQHVDVLEPAICYPD